MNFFRTFLIIIASINSILLAMQSTDENTTKNIEISTFSDEQNSRTVNYLIARELFNSPLWDQITDHLKKELINTQLSKEQQQTDLKNLFNLEKVEIKVLKNSSDLSWGWLWQTWYQKEHPSQDITIILNDASLNALYNQDINKPCTTTLHIDGTPKGIGMPALTGWLILGFLGTYGTLKLLEKIVTLKTPRSLKIV